MGFRDVLRLKDLAEFLTAAKHRVLLQFVGDDDSSFPVVSRATPLPVEVVAGGSGGGAAPTLVPLGPHLTLALDGTARAPTWPTGTLGARIGISGGSARVAVSTPNPTPTEGLLWPDGSVWTLAAGDIAGFKALRASGAPMLDVQPLGAG